MFESYKVLFYDNENHAFGMGYINQFVISEDDQIECSGAYEIKESYDDNVKLSIENHLEHNKKYEGKLTFFFQTIYHGSSNKSNNFIKF